jgi:hypothetical protein
VPVDVEREVTLAAVAPADVAARLGGDEFVVVLPDIGRVDNATRVARRIIDTLSRPFCLNGIDITLSASIGLSLFPWDGRDAVGLLDRADAAMYRAKAAGRRCWVCSGNAGHGDLAAAFEHQAPGTRARRDDPPSIGESSLACEPRGAVFPPTALSHWEITAL